MQPQFWHSENYESLGKWADGISRMQLQNGYKAGSYIDAKTTSALRLDNTAPKTEIGPSFNAKVNNVCF